MSALNDGVQTVEVECSRALTASARLFLAKVPDDVPWAGSSRELRLPANGTVEAAILHAALSDNEKFWRYRSDRLVRPGDVGLAGNSRKFKAYVDSLRDHGWPFQMDGADAAGFVLKTQEELSWLYRALLDSPKVDLWMEAEKQRMLHGDSTSWNLHAVGELLEKPAPTQWLVADFLEANSTACVYGASTHGKSFIAIDLACSVAAGIPWHGKEVKQGPVAYLCGEGHAGIRRRFLAWRIARGVQHELPVAISDAAVDVCGNMQRVATQIEAMCRGAPKLIVVDTLVNHLPPNADENSGADVNPMLRALDTLGRQFGATVVVVHHVGHAATGRERGWSGIRAAMDASFFVSKGSGALITMQASKMKDHAEPEPMRFALRSIELPWRDDLGRPDTSAVLEVAGTAQVVAGKNQGLALTALRELLEASNGEPVAVDAWRKKSGLPRNRWRETHDALTESGAVLLDDGFATLPE